MVKFVRSVQAIGYKDSATVVEQDPKKFASNPTNLDPFPTPAVHCKLQLQKKSLLLVAVSLWPSRSGSGSVIICTNTDRDPAPDPSINKQKNLGKPWFQFICDFFMTCYQCCGSGMFIPDPDFYPSRIQNPGYRISDTGSRIQQQYKRGGWKICLSCHFL